MRISKVRPVVLDLNGIDFILLGLAFPKIFSSQQDAAAFMNRDVNFYLHPEVDNTGSAMFVLFLGNVVIKLLH